MGPNLLCSNSPIAQDVKWRPECEQGILNLGHKEPFLVALLSRSPLTNNLLVVFASENCCCCCR